MSGKLRYYNGTEWEQLAPTKQEFDDLKNTTTSHLADDVTIKHKAKTIGLDSSNFTSKNVEGAMGELFQNVSNGKQVVATAITGKGVPTSSGDTFTKMATNIDNIITDPSGDANATASQILAGRTAYVNKQKVTGTMKNNGNVNATITTQGGSYTIPSGYHSGSGRVTASFANLVAGNIKSGVNVGGVVGNYTGEVLFVTGVGAIDSTRKLIIRGLPFKPNIVLVAGINYMNPQGAYVDKDLINSNLGYDYMFNARWEAKASPSFAFENNAFIIYNDGFSFQAHSYFSVGQEQIYFAFKI